MVRSPGCRDAAGASPSTDPRAVPRKAGWSVRMLVPAQRASVAADRHDAQDLPAGRLVQPREPGVAIRDEALDLDQVEHLRRRVRSRGRGPARLETGAEQQLAQ